MPAERSVSSAFDNSAASRRLVSSCVASSVTRASDEARCWLKAASAASATPDRNERLHKHGIIRFVNQNIRGTVLHYQPGIGSLSHNLFYVGLSDKDFLSALLVG